MTDTESPKSTKASAFSSTFTVYAKPTATSLTPSNSVIIVGQGVTFNVLVSGGAGPFTLELMTASNGVAANTLTNVPSGIRTFGAVFPQVTPAIYNVVGIDTGVMPQFTFNSASSSITVNNAPPSTTSTSTSTTSTSTTTVTSSTTTMPVSNSTTAPTTTVSGGPGGPGEPVTPEGQAEQEEASNRPGYSPGPAT